MKEFDYEKARAGARLCTRDGRPARIVSWDAKSPDGVYPIVALVQLDVDDEEVDVFSKKGLFYGLESAPSPRDLMLADCEEGEPAKNFDDHDRPDGEPARTCSAIDWEQRRYEVARELFAATYGHEYIGNCLKDADQFIGMLRKFNTENPIGKEERK